jgi:hypothetical protein
MFKTRKIKKIKQIFLIALFCFFYVSCSNDTIDLPITNADISKYDYLKPIAFVENKQEAEEVRVRIKKMFQNLTVNLVSSDSISPNSRENVFKVINKTDNSVRFKANGIEDGSSDSKILYGGGVFNINIKQQWDANGNIKIDTWGSGLSLFYECQQTSTRSYMQQGNDWYNPVSEVSGVVIYKILVKGVFEICRETVSFTVNGGVYPKH